jgi:hypothetical protein
MGNCIRGERAIGLIKSCRNAPHRYLADYGFPHELGLVSPNRDLVVPLYYARGGSFAGVRLYSEESHQSDQLIWIDGGQGVTSPVHWIRPPREEAKVLCRGYAAGLSIAAAVCQYGWATSVVVCFDNTNMVRAARFLSGRCFVFADHDKDGAGELAALKTQLPYCMSPVPGEDANALHQRAGTRAVWIPLARMRGSEVR